MLIAAVLVLLFVAPFFTSARLQSLRRHAAEYTSPALVRVNDLQAALATETAARSETVVGGGQSAAAESAAIAARTAATEDERALDSLVGQLGPVAVERRREMAAAISAWQVVEDRFATESRAGAAMRSADGTAERTRRWQAVEQVMSSAQHLEDELTRLTELERVEIARLERINVLVPAALVPLALLALGAVAWTARRTILLWHEARQGRLATEEAMAAKSALMRGVTHDLKNPLGAARGYADLLAEGAMGPVPDAQARTVLRLRSLISTTLETVNDLVDLSRADEGGLRVDRLETDVVAIATEVADDYRAMAESAGLQLVLDTEAMPPGAPTMITTDPVRVRQVLGNLVSNAVKYTPRGGTVRLRAETTADDALGPVLTLDVADDGPGIPEPLRERVFEEFFRVPATVGSVAGAGVGLAIARRIARLLRGDIRLRDTPGGGATFTLLLPNVR